MDVMYVVGGWGISLDGFEGVRWVGSRVVWIYDGDREGWDLSFSVFIDAFH